MGVSLKGVFQVKDKRGIWSEIHGVGRTDWLDCKYESLLQAILLSDCTVLKYRGIDGDGPITPLCAGAGLPADYCATHPDASVEGACDIPNNVNAVWGLKSWLPVYQLLPRLSTYSNVRQYGVVTLEDYNKWDKVSAPEIYAGYVSGDSVMILDQKDYNPNLKLLLQPTHINVSWEVKVPEAIKPFITYLKKLFKNHGRDVRFLFSLSS